METMHTVPLKMKQFISEMQYPLHWYLEKKNEAIWKYCFHLQVSLYEKRKVKRKKKER